MSIYGRIGVIGGVAAGSTLCLMGILGQIASVPSSFSPGIWLMRAQPIYPLSGVLLALGVMIIGGCLIVHTEWAGKKTRLVQITAFAGSCFAGAVGYLIANYLLGELKIDSMIMTTTIAVSPSLILLAGSLITLTWHRNLKPHAPCA